MTMCMRCGRDLPDDAPGAACPCVRRRPLSNLGRVAITAASMGDLRETIEEAAGLHRSEVQA